MKPAALAYHDPASVEDAVSLLANLEDAKVLAGGQSLMPMLNMRFLQPTHVIDLNAVSGLAWIDEQPDGIRIGAMTRQRDLAASPVMAARMPIVAEALTWVGHFQTRTRGTLGGSLCHLDPAAELPVIASVYDAEVTVEGPEGARRIPFAEWPLAYMIPAIAPEEMAVSVHFPAIEGRQGHAFMEYARRHGDFAIVAVGCVLTLGPGGDIASARIAVGGADQVVCRAPEAEAALAGATPGPEAFRAAAEAAAAGIETMGDAYVSAAYRSRLVKVLTERAAARAAERAAAA
jgi:carbon-monoxide dehydrogenase medium subunit